MKLLIFDLDLTLVNTTNCQDYLKTAAGREVIVDLLGAGTVSTSLYYPDTVAYVNSLVSRFNRGETNTLPIIISDSPKAYCEAVLAQHGFDIARQYVFGSARKPCVRMDEIFATIDSYDLDDIGVEECLVVGDSARDMFFAHEIESPCIWTNWSYVEQDHMYPFHTSKPTRTATNLEELKGFIEEYIAGGGGGFGYEKPNFQEDWDILSVDLVSFTEHQVKDIGFVKHYVPEAFTTRNQDYISTFFEVHWMVKPAKDVPKDDLWNKVQQRFYKKGGGFANASQLIRTAGIYKYRFKEWLDNKGITGKVLVVPVPSSVPAECNKTHTVKLIAQWWTNWLNGMNPKPNFELVHYDLLVERFQPKEPTHAKGGERLIEDQLSTMGVFRGVIGKLPEDISAVVFLDDVATSGQSINAMATIFRELGVVSDETPLYGYVWYQTHHPTTEIDFSALIALADKVAAEN
ncbi:HAD family hydrolase [Vibrio cholerae]|nr:HAD family hydrolase [Vibrio cholerae]